MSCCNGVIMGNADNRGRTLTDDAHWQSLNRQQRRMLRLAANNGDVDYDDDG